MGNWSVSDAAYEASNQGKAQAVRDNSILSQLKHIGNMLEAMLKAQDIPVPVHPEVAHQQRVAAEREAKKSKRRW